MPPFLKPVPVASGIKEKVDSTAIHGDRLYLGTATGNLHIYNINDPATVPKGEDALTLVEVKKNLVRKAIDQLGVIKEINSLVVLSEMNVTLFPLPSLTPATQLVKAKAAFSFGTHTSIQTLQESPTPSANGDFASTKPLPTLVTQLVVGCRRRMVIYSWKDGEAQEVKEAAMPHSARIITFLNHDTIYMAYAATEYAIFSIPTMTATDIVTPMPTTASTGTFGGLAGYMTLGLGAKAKPGVIQMSDSEVLIARENEGIPLGLDGKPSRPLNISWPAPPEEIVSAKPYILSLLPPSVVPVESSGSSSPTAAQPSYVPSSVVQIQSILTLQHTQSLVYPFNGTTPTAGTAVAIRLITPSAAAKSPLYFLTTPIDRTAATSEGSKLWQLTMKPWADQIDELVIEERYADALALIDTLDATLLPDKDQRTSKIRGLHAVSQFKEKKYKLAFQTFSKLDLNPAKVVALFPERIAGRISVPREWWTMLFGGPTEVDVDDDDDDDEEGGGEKAEVDWEKKDNSSTKSSNGQDAEQVTSPVVTIGSTNGGSLTGKDRHKAQRALAPGGSKDPEAAAIVGRKRGAPQTDFEISVDCLITYLSEPRPKLNAALQAVNITPRDHYKKFTPLSELALEELFALPDAQMSALTPEQLLRFAQIVDTALYKSYMATKPSLLGPWCRLPNWCEVSEVEEDLRAAEKFAELRDLYKGKSMHGKALELLRTLGEQTTDMEEKLMPSINYLQKLGPEHLDQIFQSSKWLFEKDADMAFHIFTSEDVELPRQSVADFLESVTPAICIRYLEYLIEEKDEKEPAMHDRLAELYFRSTLAERKKGEAAWKGRYAKLLAFIETNNVFALDRMYGTASSTDLYEARAILLGRLGRHDQALELYAYKLNDYRKAEEYCKRIYRPNTETQSIFLTLLRIYLRPTTSLPDSVDLLTPALDLISRHAPRLDSAEALSLLPPLVTAQDVKAFLIDAVRVPRFDTRVIKNMCKAHKEATERKLMILQAKRVKVTDSRICPQCHKRIGTSVISVHSPRGEVTHYQCKDAFAKRLQEPAIRLGKPRIL